MKDFESVSSSEFIDELKRKNLEGRRAMVAELRKRSSDKAVSILVDLLSDESWYLRELAVEALGEIGSKSAPQLRRLLAGGLWYTRAASARAIGRMGYEPVIPDLVELLDDPNHTVQGACFASLAEMVSRGHTRQVARALWDRGQRRAEELKRLMLAVQPEAGEKVAEMLKDPASLLARHGALKLESKDDFEDPGHEVEVKGA